MPKNRTARGLAVSFRSIFVRCLAIMALTTVVVAGAMAFQTLNTVNQLARKGVVTQAARLVDTYAEALVAPMRFSVAGKIDETVAGALEAASASGSAAVAVDGAGARLSAAGEAGLADALAALASDAVRGGETVTAQDGLWVARPVRPEAGADPIGAIALAMNDRQALQSVADDKQRVALVAGGLFTLMTILSWLMLRRLIGGPLETLRAAIARVGDGDYDTPVAMQDRRDELGHIARDLGRMVETLARGREAERARETQHEAQVAVVMRLGEGMDALARGVLNTRIAEAFPADYEALRGNFNNAIQSLEAAIAAVYGNAQGITDGATEIARASDDLARRTETQAATLEQTAAALEELLRSVTHAAQGAEEADSAVGRARDMAARNDEVMRSAMTAMVEIEKSAEQIGEIITVIDDIAFQTNLLALNAGVEAARAGSSGKGFAVVASEVRALAQRSSDAARQIKDLISGSTDQVKRGARLVEQAGSALEEVVSQVGEISDLVSAIARGASEQAQGLNEINVGVGNLDKVTQQNAAMVEQSTAAAHMLRSEASNLSDLVNRFEIGTDSGSKPVELAERKGRAA